MNQNILTSDINARVRALESKYNLLAEHLLVVNRNMIEEYKNITIDTKRINSDIKEIKKELDKIKLTIKTFIKETELFAKKGDLKILEKYINLWNPMEFVTTKELNDALKKKTKKKVVKKHSKRK